MGQNLMLKLSFIVTAFNRPDALRTCLSSLVQQTFTDWEAIVCDNSDNAANLGSNAIMTSMDQRISYKFTGGDVGIDGTIHKYSLYQATEMGIADSTGAWLCLPNDDSYYCPWFAERMLAAAERENWELVYSDIVMGGAGGHYPMQCSPRLCCIDKTNFIVKRSRWNGWVNATGAGYAQADGHTVMDLVARGIRHGRVPELLVVHN
jgi:glycosyltransferase involved in cell wall biosynthesis